MTPSKNFINFHILMSHSPSCLNRDDMNMQKTAIFGGITRVRISSQSLKRAVRTSPYYAQHLGTPSVRTRKLDRLKIRLTAILEKRFEAGLIARTLEWMSGKEGIAEGVQADAVAPWSVEEVAYFCQQIQDGEKDGLDAKKLQKQIEKNARPFREAMGKALDIALSGRMATSGLMTHLPVDGALSVAHVLTTHAVEPQDVDWFTAVDDLVQDAGEVGAGHLDTQQFSAGVFYRYASLNLKQLQVNLGLLAGMDSAETPESRQRALDIARHVFHLFATIVPSAKQHSFAAFNPADFAVVSFGDVPISLVNAFEQPIQRAKNGGFLAPSMRALAAYWNQINIAYGLDERAVAFRFDETPWNDTGDQGGCKEDRYWPDRLQSYAKLAEVEAWIADDGQH